MLAFLPAVFLLIGAGCAPAVPVAPEPPAMMEKENDDAMIEEKKDGTSTMQKEEGLNAPSAVMMNDEAKVAREMMAPAANPSYTDYSPEAAAEALASGYGVVYYFWASWCPICKAEEPKLRQWIENSKLPIAGFRVNFDTEKELKAKFKVPYQHTTVFLNAKGEGVERFNGPVDEAAFVAALKKTTQ